MKVLIHHHRRLATNTAAAGSFVSQSYLSLHNVDHSTVAEDHDRDRNEGLDDDHQNSDRSTRRIARPDLERAADVPSDDGRRRDLQSEIEDDAESPHGGLSCGASDSCARSDGRRPGTVRRSSPGC